MNENNISDSEIDLMKIIWSQKDSEGNYISINTNEIMEYVKDRWSVSTVFTLLSRLEKKGFVASHKVGRSNEYVALVEEKEYLGKESHRFIDKLYNGSLKNLIAAFCDESVSKDEVEELEKFLAERKRVL